MIIWYDGYCIDPAHCGFKVTFSTPRLCTTGIHCIAKSCSYVKMSCLMSCCSWYVCCAVFSCEILRSWPGHAAWGIHTVHVALSVDIRAELVCFCSSIIDFAHKLTRTLINSHSWTRTSHPSVSSRSANEIGLLVWFTRHKFSSLMALYKYVGWYVLQP